MDDDDQFALVAMAVLTVLLFWVVGSFFEARAFNRLTGAHATTWDAMWTELRVQAPPKRG